jgi:hypothetical protein
MKSPHPTDSYLRLQPYTIHYRIYTVNTIYVYVYVYTFWGYLRIL